MDATNQVGDTMITLFECWNGGIVEWDGLSSPQISFSFPIVNGDVLAFFLICGRIAQLHSRTDWQLRFGTKSVRIPQLPQAEVSLLAERIRHKLGYMPLLINDVRRDIHAEESLLRRLQWVEIASGRIDAYLPFVGLRQGKQCYVHKLTQQVLSGAQAEVRFSRDGHLCGGSDFSLMQLLGIHREPQLHTSSMLLQQAWHQQEHASNL